MKMSSVQTCHEGCEVSLKPIFIGTLVGLGLDIILAVLVAVFNPKVFLVDTAGIAVFSSVGFIILLLSVLIAHFVGGWAAAYLGQSHNSCSLKGILYGFSTWVLGLFIFIAFFSQLNYYFEKQVMGLYSAPPAGVRQAAVKEKQAMQVGNSSSEKNTDEAPYTPYGLPLFVLFVFLATGGGAACFGGYAGTKCRKEEETY